MQALERHNRIIVLLARFKHEVEIANAHSYTDINRESQNVLVSLFRVIFQLPDLRNLDLTDPNSAAIDIADDTRRIAFQITSEQTGKKIKETLETFRDYRLDQKYDRLVVYVLTEKQSRYTTDFSQFAPSSFTFVKKRDILDYTDILPNIKMLSESKQLEVLNLLETNFSDEVLQDRKWQEQRLAPHQATFVRPAQYDRALDTLRQYGILVLAGPPHIGKTETAFALLLQVSEEKNYGSILYLPEIKDWTKLNSLRQRALLLDDPFGASRLDNPAIADRFEDIVRLADDNLIVITSRQGVLNDACEGRRIGQSGSFKSLLIQLQQEGSYTTEDLYAILQNLVSYAQTSVTANGFQLSAAQASTLLKACREITWRLRFPHNIERLVNFHSKTLKPDTDIDDLIEAAKDIKRAVQDWFKEQDRSTQVFATTLALFPHNPPDEILKFYRTACAELAVQETSIQKLIRDAAGYIALDTYAAFAHPSYAEGIVASLKGDYLDFAWDILRIRARYSVDLHLNSLLQCRQAIRLLGQKWQPEATPSPYPATFEQYFGDFISTYNLIIERNFPAIRASFEPEWSGEASVRVDMSLEGELHCWSIWRRLENEPLVSTSVNKSIPMPGNLCELDVEAREKTGYMYPSRHYGIDITHSIPQIAAVDEALEQLTRAISSRTFPKKEFLAESWHLRMARLLAQLRSASFPLDTLSTDTPLTEDRLKEFFLPSITAIQKINSLSEEMLSHFSEWPPAISFKDLFIPDAIQDIKALQAEGHPISGAFLVPPDLTWENCISRPGGASFSDVYSDEQLTQAVITGISLMYDAYKAIAELNFPTLCKQMWLYSHLPVKIVCVLDRDDRESLSRPRINYGIVPLREKNAMSAAQVEVHLISESVSLEARERAISAREALWSEQNTEYIQAGSCDARDFFHIKDWRNSVIDLIASDLKSYIGDWP